MNEVKVLVATHKTVKIPNFGDCYELIQVGAAQHENLGYLCDNSGDNISTMNPTYCELSALYWGWKNLNTDIKGLCHYRRFLAKRYFSVNNKTNVFSEEELINIFNSFDIILPEKKYRNLNNAWYASLEQLEKDRSYIAIKKAILKLCPEYLSSVNNVFMSKKMSFCNVMIAKSNIYNSYCEWLFAIEKEIENVLDKSMGGVKPREMGFISEWLLNVWIDRNSDKFNIKYTPLARIDRPVNIKIVLLVLLERTKLLYLAEKIKFEHIYRSAK